MKLKTDALTVWQELKEMNNLFPYRCCRIAASRMNELGYEIVRGVIRVSNYCGLGIKKELPHVWNYDKETKIFVDLTASQFNIHLPKLEHMPDIYFWQENDIHLHDRYVAKKIGSFQAI